MLIGHHHLLQNMIYFILNSFLGVLTSIKQLLLNEERWVEKKIQEVGLSEADEEQRVAGRERKPGEAVRVMLEMCD